MEKIHLSKKFRMVPSQFSNSRCSLSQYICSSIIKNSFVIPIDAKYDSNFFKKSCEKRPKDVFENDYMPNYIDTDLWQSRAERKACSGSGIHTHKA